MSMMLPGARNPMLAPASASMIASGGPALTSHLLNDTEGITTPRSLYGWEGPAAAWPCHCCNRVNEELTKRCKTCGRSAAYGKLSRRKVNRHRLRVKSTPSIQKCKGDLGSYLAGCIPGSRQLYCLYSINSINSRTAAVKTIFRTLRAHTIKH